MANTNCKEIQSTIPNAEGKPLELTYRDIDSEAELGARTVNGIHAYCFYEDKLVIVCSEGYWMPPGGSVEEGESVCDAVRREVQEESNMNVLKDRFIGYQDIFEPAGVVTQVRSVCLVEPHGPFLSDPDGDVTEIKLIDPQEYKTYFDWGVVGDHIMQRALELKAQMESSS